MAVAPVEALGEAFRNAMALVCTPVAVITAMDDDRAHGTTVSAFASLSMSPPSLLVSLDRDSDLLRIIRQTGAFGVNVLGKGQSVLASRFARKGRDKFADVDWSLTDGVPRLAGAPGWFACAVAQTVEAADHVVLIGEVHSVDSVSAAPLTYHARTFGTHHVSS
ncbi:MULTISPECIES: flavin reductase family protein [Mycobacterium avium complex (MAC)]|uniref:Flavin reductase n=1 Tax=Mycobacterium arosiense ATCC BAA-1401 = DSM 45069 TaxID=1265311 RepID=A0A1W9ZID4_MYCAI|nr:MULTISPECIES: flavin reductase family protein [Mycobacterium avium complex (MAC)]ORA15690.1 flavin reductase [Mycobacterium arosiense ATCC BAA-1401 = DSM 45069]